MYFTRFYLNNTHLSNMAGNTTLIEKTNFEHFTTASTDVNVQKTLFIVDIMLIILWKFYFQWVYGKGIQWLLLVFRVRLVPQPKFGSGWVETVEKLYCYYILCVCVSVCVCVCVLACACVCYMTSRQTYPTVFCALVCHISLI